MVVVFVAVGLLLEIDFRAFLRAYNDSSTGRLDVVDADSVAAAAALAAAVIAARSAAVDAVNAAVVVSSVADVEEGGNANDGSRTRPEEDRLTFGAKSDSDPGMIGKRSSEDRKFAIIYEYSEVFSFFEVLLLID